MGGPAPNGPSVGTPVRDRASEPATHSTLPPVDVLVATYNSVRTLEPCLRSARAHLPIGQLIVVDHASTDGTPELARRFGARVLTETTGLGRARNLALEEARTDPVLFLDSDVVIVRPDYYARAIAAYRRPGTAAVVGTSVGYPFSFGLPLGLTLIGREWARGAGIPDDVQGRETYYLQRRARRERRRVRYVPESMQHYGTYRASPTWPEFQGAWVRITGGGSPRELLYSYLVIALMSANSRSARTLAYAPVFGAKLTRGFLSPARWARLDRTSLPSAA